MYSITNNYKDKIENNTSLSPQSKIVVDGIEYTGKILKTAPKLKHQSTSLFGGFPTKTCSFEIYDFNNELDFENKEIYVYKGLVINNEIEYIPQGIFIPQADKISTNISQRSISFNDIQDRSQKFDSQYISDLDWSNKTHTGLEIVQEICDKVDVPLGTVDFNWSIYNFNRPNFPSNISNREVISRLAEIGGSIAYIDRDGKLVIKSPTSTGHLIQRKRYEKATQEKIIGPYNTVVLGMEGLDNDIVYPEQIDDDRIEYKILDNPFVDLNPENMIEEVAKYILNKSYIPFSLTNFVDGFYLDLNDTIEITNKNGEIFTGLILSYESTSRIKADIKAEIYSQNKTNYNLAGSAKQSLADVRFQVDHINKQVQSTIEEVDGQNEKITQVTQTVDELNQKISNIADLTVEGSSITNILSLEKVFGGSPLSMKIYPIGKNISLLYPNIGINPNTDLYIPIRYVIFENTETNEKFKYELPDDLLFLNSDVYDIFELDYQNNICQITKNCEYNADGTVYQLDKPITKNLSLPDLNLTKGNYNIYLPSYDLAYLYCKFAAQNDYTSVFATKAEMTSNISQTAEEINLEVSKKISNDDGGIELASLIRQTAELIYLSANNFGWESKNSSMTTDGNLTANNATLNSANIVGGNITLQDGAQIVGGDGLLTNLVYVGFTRGSMLMGSGDFIPLGQASTGQDSRNMLMFTFMLPKNFVIKSAKVHISHTPIKWYNYYDDSSISSVTGYSRNLRLYKVNSYNVDFYEWGGMESSSNITEIRNAFGSSGFTGSSSTTTSTESIDISDQISVNSVNQFGIRTADAQVADIDKTANQQTGGVFGYIEIIGYTKFQ